MSIKSELSSLRKKNRELRLLIRECSCKLKEEEAKQKAISDEAEPFAKRKSEFARKFYHEYEQKIEIQAKEINKIESVIEQYQRELLSNEEKIDEYLYNTSFYINEQVPYLVEGFLNYVQENEIKLARNITNEFYLMEFRGCHDFYSDYPPNGNFGIKGDNRTVIAETKDYYFEANTIYVYWNDDLERTERTLADWYKEYTDDFRNAFFKALKEKFKSDNFKLIIDGYSFTLDLI